MNNFEDSKTGRLPESLYVNIPEDKYAQAMLLNEHKKGKIDFDFPLADGVKYMHDDNFKNYINRTWEPTLTYIGVDGMPCCHQAGNVLRPKTVLGLSLRLPPTLEPKTVTKTLEEYFDKAKKICSANVSLDIV